MTTRTYRLACADRTGWFLGLGAAQMAPLVAGLTVAVIVVATTGLLPLGAAAFGAGAVAGFVRVGDLPLFEMAPTALAYLIRRDRRFDAGLPFPGADLVLPAAFGRVEFAVGDLAGEPILVAHDSKAGLAAATLRVSAPSPFLLCDETDQARFLDTFGDALAPMCRESGPVASLRWSSFAQPAGRPAGGGAHGPARSAYGQVLDLLTGDPQHEVLLTVTVRCGRSVEKAAETAVGEVGLLVERLAGTGLEAAPCTAEGFAQVLRRRLDPEGRGSPGHLGTLALATGLAPVAAAGPLCAVERWRDITIDTTVHRTYQIIEWPRSEIPPGWTADLLLALPVTRNLSVVFEPVTARTSRRAVQRMAAKLDSDEEQRRRAGFRIGADQEASRDELAARERELVAGHAEFDYSGLVVLSAPDRESLAELEARARSVAAAAGVELAPCHGRHAAMLALGLPLPDRLPRRPR